MALPSNPNPNFSLNPRAMPYTTHSLSAVEAYRVPGGGHEMISMSSSRVLLPHHIISNHYEQPEGDQPSFFPTMALGPNSYHLPNWGYYHGGTASYPTTCFPYETYSVPFFPTTYAYNQFSIPFPAAPWGTYHPAAPPGSQAEKVVPEDYAARWVEKPRAVYMSSAGRKLIRNRSTTTTTTGGRRRISAPRFESKRSKRPLVENSSSRYPGMSWIPKKAVAGETEKELDEEMGRMSGGGGDGTVTERVAARGRISEKSVGGGHDGGEVVLRGKTSLMIRNIPNYLQYNSMLSLSLSLGALVNETARELSIRSNLLRIMDDYCWEQNQKASLHPRPVCSEYDFLYLPMDFRRGLNLGYAFVNFTNAAAASRFSNELDKFDWNEKRVKHKICKITLAALQGRDALCNQFKNSLFPCHTDEYLPVVLEPPSNGSSNSRLVLVGRRRIMPA
ncbi:hypothetical protein Tsubulata_005354 [Turnera subulata]|uniref:Mei2-like C-terminal RNA recognition motif domain-containing protein n=1 Tax=Turnera subulata TaxID=218843 RepID=A0A9Q0GFQ1_9ROSI|nr:hypothetical protein Tsubulata_005354 [Turnera subulata]